MQNITTTQPEVNEYDQQGIDFLEKTGTKLTTKFYGHDYYFPKDEYCRDIFKVTLKNKNGSYTFRFGQSVANSGGQEPKHPTGYDIFASIAKK